MLHESDIGERALRTGPASGSCDLKAIVRMDILTRGILHSKDQRLISRKGGENAWLIDLRPLCLDACFLDAITDLFWDAYADQGPFQVGGMEVAAVPLVAAILMKSKMRGTPINGFVVRRERKTYGAGNSIEGKILPDIPIVIVDDIFNSGASLEKVRANLAVLDQRIASVFVIVDFLNANGKRWTVINDIELRSLFHLAEFGLRDERPKRRAVADVFKDRWHFTSPDPNFFHQVPKSSPLVTGDRVFFGSDSGIFRCLNAFDGAVIWEFKVVTRGHKGIWSAASEFDGRIYFGAYDGNFYCLEADTGREIWRFSGGDWIGSSPALAPDLGLVFISLQYAVDQKRGGIAALDMLTGEMIWHHQTRRYTQASPVYDPGRKMVACGSNDNELFLFDAETGRLRWRFETADVGELKGSIRHAAAFDSARDQIVTGCANGHIYVVDIHSGEELCSVKTDGTIYTAPLVVGDKAYIGSTDKNLYIIDLDILELKSRIAVGGRIFSPAAYIGNHIYFSATDGIVYELDPVSDVVTGVHQLPDAITNRIGYSPKTGLFYALTYVNQLFAMAHV